MRIDIVSLHYLLMLTEYFAKIHDCDGTMIQFSNFDYCYEKIRFQSNNNQLHGTLFFPDVSGSHPALIAVLGSLGVNYLDYWKEDAIPLWKSITDHLLDNDFAVLFYNKPGVGDSGGDWSNESFADRAANTKAAIDFLRNHNRIRTNDIGVIGHSQGGWIAQKVGADHPDLVKYIISSAGPAVSVNK